MKMHIDDYLLQQLCIEIQLFNNDLNNGSITKEAIENCRIELIECMEDEMKSAIYVFYQNYTPVISKKKKWERQNIFLYSNININININQNEIDMDYDIIMDEHESLYKNSSPLSQEMGEELLYVEGYHGWNIPGRYIAKQMNPSPQDLANSKIKKTGEVMLQQAFDNILNDRIQLIYNLML